jgi:PAS domain S-box-containing protein
MHPEYYRARGEGAVEAAYYAPQILSSSYIVRRAHVLYNEERVRAGLLPIQYKLASENPRNPVNRADAHEAELLRRFNADRSLRDHRTVLTLDGQEYLEFAVPFLETTPACLRCHGRREDAPPGLATLYPEQGGFDEQAGRIRAVEVIRAPVQSEVRLGWTITGALGAGLLSLAGLFLFNGRLRDSVQERTRTLQEEVHERLRAQGEVVRLKDSLAAVVTAMPSAIVGLDEKDRVTLWNERAERGTGVPAAAALGRPVAELLPWIAPHLGALGGSTAAPGRLERVSVELDGRRRHLDVAHYPLSAHGVRGAVLRVDDVTERVHLDAHLAQAQKLEAIGTLAGGIAHDFNNILSAIRGYTELALERPLEPDLREDLQAVLDATGRAIELTKQILTFSRQAPQAARPVQPAVVVREALKLLRAAIPSTVEIRTDLRSEAPVLADPADLHRVVVNLCTNAAHAMKDGGLLEVVVDEAELDAGFGAAHQECEPGRYLRLTVRDSGVGMPPEVQARVFEPFFTTRTDLGGTGMGLATVHGIVRQLGGTISVTSALGQGTSFVVYLPAGAASAPPADPALEPQPGTERVLFVDDEAAVCRLAERVLRPLGYRVTALTSPLQALAAFRADPAAFDVVVSDMTMPGLTGDLLAQQLRALRPDLPVVLCSGYSERLGSQRTAALGVDVLATKPVVGAQLSRVIRTALARHASPPAGPPTPTSA